MYPLRIDFIPFPTLISSIIGFTVGSLTDVLQADYNKSSHNVVGESD
jgi:hypothetical protein